VGPRSLPDRELVVLAARVLGRSVRIGSIPKRLLSAVLAVRQRIAGPGFSPDALEVIASDTRLDPQPAASALGIALTGIDEMIVGSLGVEAGAGANENVRGSAGRQSGPRTTT
jgi:hypothetical protein